MAEGQGSETGADERTEEATPQRLERARRDGDVPFSREPGQLLILVAALVWLGAVLPGAGPRFLEHASDFLARVAETETGNGAASAGTLLRELGLEGAALLAPLLALALLAPLVSAFAQQSVVLTGKKLAPKLDRLSPLAGAKRLVSARNLVEFLKNLAKVLIAAVIVGLILHGEIAAVLASGAATLGEGLALMGGLTLRLLTAVVAFAAVLAALDVVWQRVSWRRRLRMSRRDIKDELKTSEGSPEVKARRRQLHRERSQRRMLADVPRAAVVITNPTHYAVALAYDERSEPVPRVVAKGRDAMALKIREAAIDARVPVVGNPPMARVLHATLEVGDVIRPEQYRAVANIIGYVLGRRG